MSASTAVGARRSRCFDQTAPWIGPDGCHNTSGGFAGGQAGYRWQMLPGCSASKLQGDWAEPEGAAASASSRPPTSTARASMTSDLFTGQVGYAWNTALLYFKGGAAVVADRNEILTNGAVLATASGDNRWGGTVGAGIEFSFAPNWSAAIEYNHLFIPNNNTNFTNAARALSSAPTAFTAMPTWCRFASTTAGAARSSRSTDRVCIASNFEKPASVPAFLCAAFSIVPADACCHFACLTRFLRANRFPPRLKMRAVPTIR